MSDYKKSVKLALAVTYIFMILLVLLTIALPWLVIWYAEIMGRSQSLAKTIMLTCYPCVPLAAVSLISVRRFLINISKLKIFDEQNIVMLKRTFLCCLAAAVIMFIAGFFYMPFFIASAAAATCALLITVIKNLIHAAIVNKDNK